VCYGANPLLVVVGLNLDFKGESMQVKCLDIGPGTVDRKSKAIAGADTLDMLEGGTYQAHWGYEALPIEDSTYDCVYASHVLEHIAWYRSEQAVAEVARILKPNGCFHVHVPNFNYIIQCYLEGKLGDNWRVFNPDNDLATWLNGRIFSYDTDATELLSPDRPIPQTIHKAVFTPASLVKLLSKYFESVQQSNRVFGQSHGPIEMSFIAYHPTLKNLPRKSMHD